MKASVDERFTMNSYAEGLATMLQDSSLPVPLLMGIHGKYGSGKTQLVKAVLWKVRRVCGFSCTNMGSPVEHSPVRWTYRSCRCCCSTSFFGYLLALVLLFFIVVAGVVGFMIWASVAYQRSLPVDTSAIASNVSSVGNYDGLLNFASNGVLYPLLAATAFMGAGLLLVMVTVALYYCHDHTGASGRSRWQHFKTILIMLLCQPPPEPMTRKHDAVDVIPVVFSAWEYAGCDVLWAGIIKNIFHQVEAVFGKWKLRLFRTFRSAGLSHQHDLSVLRFGGGKDISAYFGESLNSKSEAKVTVDPDAAGSALREIDLHTAKWLHVPYPLLALLALSTIAVSVLVIVLLAAASNIRELAALEHYIQLAAGLLLGLTALSQLSNIWALLQSVCQSQSGQLDRAVQRVKGPDLSGDLGFMHTVKVEVQRITGFVKLMQRLYQKKFRILIVIDDLDRCEASRIVSLLEAIGILLSDADSLFVTLVALDHEVVASAISGHRSDSTEFLRRLVQMRFYIPEWTASDMENVLDRNFARSYECTAMTPTRKPMSRRQPHGSKRYSGQIDSTVEMELVNDEAKTAEMVTRKKLRSRMTKLATQEMKKQIDLLPTSFCDIRHLCNMMFFTVYLWVDKTQVGYNTLDSLQQAMAETCVKLTWWVTMTEVWPYRCSWMLKHVDDMDELTLQMSRGRIDSDARHQNMLLSEVYQHVKDRIKEPDKWRKWMSNDGNPEHFELALDAFPLTVQMIKYFLPFTVNLDRTIKYAIIEHCKTIEDKPCRSCRTASQSTLGSLCLLASGSHHNQAAGSDAYTTEHDHDPGSLRTQAIFSVTHAADGGGPG